MPQFALPDAFVQQLKQQLGDAEADQLLHVLHSTEPSVSVRFNSRKKAAPTLPNDPPPLDPALLPRVVAWHEGARYLEQRPRFTADPLLHAGAYYVQEASSMFVAEAVRQTTDLSRALVLLDLCAAPGGKSTLLADLMNEQSCLVANETVRTRAHILTENLVKWGSPATFTTCNSVADFAPLSGMFDVVLLDAPCSGEGMFRKEPVAIDEWSVANVRNCARRQADILSDAIGLVAAGGVLIYSTCTYNTAENEDTLLEVLQQNEHWQSVRLQVTAEWGIVETHTQAARDEAAAVDCWAYRFYPHRLAGEGFFLSVLRYVPPADLDHAPQAKVKRTKKQQHRTPNAAALSKQQLAQAHTYLQQPQQYHYHLSAQGEVYAVPLAQLRWWQQLQQHLYLLKQGVHLATVKQNGLVPAHDLSLSTQLATTVAGWELTYREAIAFLRKTDLIPPPHLPHGWTVVRYAGLALGWLKILPNGRANNYYPTHWRIRMEI